MNVILMPKLHIVQIGRVTCSSLMGLSHQVFIKHCIHNLLHPAMAEFQVYDGLKQQLESLTGKHASLVAQQHAFAPEDLAKSDSELARLRSELAEAKAEASTNADKLAAALETCRYHHSLDCFFDHLCCVCDVSCFC